MAPIEQNEKANTLKTNVKKRTAPAFMKVQSEVTKMIREKESINHKEALTKLKHYFQLANGKEYVKNGDIKWLDGLVKIKNYLDNN